MLYIFRWDLLEGLLALVPSKGGLQALDTIGKGLDVMEDALAGIGRETLEDRIKGRG